MAYDAPDQLVDGTLIRAERWNQDVVDNTIFLHSPPGALLYSTDIQVIPATETTQIELNTTDYDTDSMVSGSNLMIRTAGVYYVYATMSASGNLAACNSRFWLQTGSGFVMASSSYQAFATTRPHWLASGFYKFNANEIVSLYMTSSVEVTRSGTRGSILAAQWICAGETTP